MIGLKGPHSNSHVFASAGAGLWTTANDQYKFYKMLMNLGIGDNGVRILKDEPVKSILAVSTRPAGLGGYSLGLTAPLAEKDGENAWFGHGGPPPGRCIKSRLPCGSLSRRLRRMDGPQRLHSCFPLRLNPARLHGVNSM